MMKKAVYLLIALILFNISLSAQNDKDVALTINGKPISKKEIQKGFNESQSVSADGQSQTIDEFLENYIFHALVLEEARSLRVDTTTSYRQELDSYKLQLTNSFLTDTITDNQLVAELSKLFQQEVQVNQVFIPLDSTLRLPSDTVIPYQKALEAREIAIKEGFDKVKSEEKIFSYGVVMDIERETGKLGWVRPFMFSYKLDQILYSIKLNEVSMPIRSGKGYHVLQVTARRPTQGNPVVEQVMFNFPVIPASNQMRDSIYNVAMKTSEEISLKDNFQQICNEFSVVYGRGTDGCLLGEINMGDQIPASIIRAAFEMKEIGEISKPIFSEYGYHILRLKDIRPVPSKEIIEARIRTLLVTDKIFPEVLARQRQRMMKDYKAKINTKAFKNLFALTATYNPKTKAFEDNVKNKTEELISIDGKVSYDVEDFLDYIDATLWLFEQPKEPDPLMQTSFSPMVVLSLSSDILEAQFNGFVYMALSKYQKESLADRVPKYSQILDKLAEDLLFTKLMERDIWEKSRLDIDGLNKMFQKNKSKYTLKGEQFKGLIVFGRTEALLSEVEKLLETEKLTASQLKRKYNQNGIMIQVEEGLWSKGDNPYVDSKLNNTKIKSSLRSFPFYSVFGRFITTPEDMSDVKPQVVADYQQELEQEFTTALKQKYNVTINNAVINNIK